MSNVSTLIGKLITVRWIEMKFRLLVLNFNQKLISDTFVYSIITDIFIEE